MSTRAPLDADRDGRTRIVLGTTVVRLHHRALFTSVILVLVLVVLALSALALGDYPLTVPQVISALFTDTGFASKIVTEWRLPRMLAALTFGAALGVSGALFQTLTRNPLGSPDVIGFSTGAYTGAIISISVTGNSVLSVTAGAVLGGLATAFVVYLLAWRKGVQGFRLIIVGIAVTSVLSSVNTYLLLRAQTEVAMAASLWGTGTLSLVGWNDLAFALPTLAALALAVTAALPGLRQLELGDDAAHAHGVRTEATRVSVLITGVSLIALVTAITGPIAFVALAAPQIARRLTRSAGIPIGATALTGALLLLAADLIAQHLIPGSVPVGVVTVVTGGCYLVALIVHRARKQP